METLDGSAQKRVRRQGVAAIGALVDTENTKAATGMQHRSGRSGSARSDHDHVVVPSRAGKLLVKCRPFDHGSNGGPTWAEMLEGRVESPCRFLQVFCMSSPSQATAAGRE